MGGQQSTDMEAMGYDSKRFHQALDTELKCSICLNVLKKAMQAPTCEHTFCSDCINQWLLKESKCPVDRRPLKKCDLKPAPRVLRNLLANLDIKCDFASLGCTAVVKLDSLASHCKTCDFNPEKPVACEKGCGVVLARKEHEKHNCLHYLRELVSKQEVQIMEQTLTIHDFRTWRHEIEQKLRNLESHIKRMWVVIGVLVLLLVNIVCFIYI